MGVFIKFDAFAWHPPRCSSGLSLLQPSPASVDRLAAAPALISTAFMTSGCFHPHQSSVVSQSSPSPSLVSCLSSQLSFRRSHSHAGDFRKPHIPPSLRGTGSSSSSFSSQHKDYLPKRWGFTISGDLPTQLIPCPRISFLAFLTI